MNWFKLLPKTVSGLLLLCLCTACATKGTPADVVINFPSAEPFITVTQADAVLADVVLANAQIDWRYRQQEQLCYSQFFVNYCLLNAKALRRTDSARVQKSEVAANYFKRKTNVDEMDRALEEKNIAHPVPVPVPPAQ